MPGLADGYAYVPVKALTHRIGRIVFEESIDDASLTVLVPIGDKRAVFIAEPLCHFPVCGVPHLAEIRYEVVQAHLLARGRRQAEHICELTGHFLWWAGNQLFVPERPGLNPSRLEEGVESMFRNEHTEYAGGDFPAIVGDIDRFVPGR